MMNEQQLLDPIKAAKYLGVTAGTLAVWRSTGRYTLPFVKIGRKVMYRDTDLNAFINERTKLHTHSFVNVD
jgi:hypothetical protein